jgi:hypothetical protein
MEYGSKWRLADVQTRVMGGLNSWIGMGRKGWVQEILKSTMSESIVDWIMSTSKGSSPGEIPGFQFGQLGDGSSLHCVVGSAGPSSHPLLTSQ